MDKLGTNFHPTILEIEKLVQLKWKKIIHDKETLKANHVSVLDPSVAKSSAFLLDVFER